MNIILASASPRRRELMKIITDNFDAVSTDADETLPANIQAKDAAAYLAVIKASCASKKFHDSLIIGCDTTVVCDDIILGKPNDKNQCREFINLLSGRTHSVITGCCLIFNNDVMTFSVETEVTFRNLTNFEIEEYISTDEPYDKAGGYGIQGKGALLIEKINGDYFNVVGLPVSRLKIEIDKILNK